MNDIIPSGNVGEVVGVGRAADQKFCFSCGFALHYSAASCPKCGAAQHVNSTAPIAPFMAAPAPLGNALPANHVFCRGCGAPVHETAEMCPKCGAPQSLGPTSRQGGSDRTTAALLAFFLGGFGAHKFYLGESVQGMIYLLFCWTFIPALIGFVEGVMYLSSSDADFRRKHH